MDVRPARPDELPAVMTVLDAGFLVTVAGDVAAGIDAGDVLVAVEEGRVLGALVLGPADGPGARVEAVAVRRARRGQGVGTALVEAARADRGRLVVAFDERVRPFWASLGFVVTPAGEDGRYVGALDGRG